MSEENEGFVHDNEIELNQVNENQQVKKPKKKKRRRKHNAIADRVDSEIQTELTTFTHSYKSTTNSLGGIQNPPQEDNYMDRVKDTSQTIPLAANMLNKIGTETQSLAVPKPERGVIIYTKSLEAKQITPNKGIEKHDIKVRSMSISEGHSVTNGSAHMQLDNNNEQTAVMTEPDKADTPLEVVKEETPEVQQQRRQSSPASAKWRSVKNAVRVTNNMSKRSTAARPSVDSFMAKFSTNRSQAIHARLSVSDEPDEELDEEGITVKKPRRCHPTCSPRLPQVMEADGPYLFYWLMVVSITVEYNLWLQILREGFPAVQSEYPGLWFTLDYLADIIYILDILVQFRTGYLEDGLLVTKQQQLTRHYMRSRYFWMDVITLLPLDFLYIPLGIHPLLRFPRFLKIYRVMQFLYLAENQSKHPNILRVSNLTHILLLLCHWFAAFYFMISKAEGPKGGWIYPNASESVFSTTTRQYLTSLYWSTLTLTTIGDLPAPESNWQYLFQIVSYLIGVFVFATIVGQVGNAINNYNSTRSEYERLLDGAKLYMRKHDVPQEMRSRVLRWCDYAWTRGRMQGAGDINSLKMLPDRLKTELALHVHLDILKQVTIFEECEPEFLHDLVLKMQTYIFTPGDLVVRKGEIAREMFIIADGHLDVMSHDGRIIASLSTGNFFGEIGILNLDGGINRRTADVRSVGYSELFVLEREDVVRAIKYYPSAKASLMKHARLRLAEMRQQSAHALESSLIEAAPLILTPHIDDELNLKVPRSTNGSPKASSAIRKASMITGSCYSLRSLDAEDTMRIKENELIAKLTQDVYDKDKRIEELTAKLLQTDKTFEKLASKKT